MSDYCAGETADILHNLSVGLRLDPILPWRHNALFWRERAEKVDQHGGCPGGWTKAQCLEFAEAIDCGMCRDDWV